MRGAVGDTRPMNCASRPSMPFGSIIILLIVGLSDYLPVMRRMKGFAQRRRDRREIWFTRRRGGAEKKEIGGSSALTLPFSAVSAPLRESLLSASPRLRVNKFPM